MIACVFRAVLLTFLAGFGTGFAAEAAPVPSQSGLVVDVVGALNEAERAHLESRLKAIQVGGQAQVAILVAAALGDEPLARYGLRVAEAWKLGRAGKDDGLLILVLPGKPAARLEVGYGLEGPIPDVLASRWLEAFMPALREGRLAEGLDTLLDRIEGALPKHAAQAADAGERYLFPDHPEWRLPWVLAVFSFLGLMPLFAGRWGGLASASLFGAIWSAAAWLLWHAVPPAAAMGAVAFFLPLVWSLNDGRNMARMPGWMAAVQWAGKLLGLLFLTGLILLFVGSAVYAVAPDQIAWALLFAGVFFFGGLPALFPEDRREIPGKLWRSYIHFVLILVLVYLSLVGWIAHAAVVALVIAGIFAALVALALQLDEQGADTGKKSERSRRLEHRLVALALLVVLPFLLFLLFRALAGQVVEPTSAGAGIGSLGGVLWWAARSGFFAVAQIGLGGLFGGGGAQSGD